MDEKARPGPGISPSLGHVSANPLKPVGGSLWGKPYPTSRVIPSRPTWALPSPETVAPAVPEAGVLPPEAAGQDRALDYREARYLREEEGVVSEARLVSESAREATGAYLSALAPWDLYATLTYDPRRYYQKGAVNGERPAGYYTDPPAPPSYYASARHLDWYHSKVQDALRRNVLLAAGFERNKAGWPHWHCIMATFGLDATAFALLSNLWFQKKGYVHLERIRPGTERRVTEYCAKYLCKEFGELQILGDYRLTRDWSRRILASRRTDERP